MAVQTIPTRLKTAVRAIWELYRRGKWSLLEALNLARCTYEPLFDSFNLACLPDLTPKPDPDEQRETLISKLDDELSPFALMCLHPEVLEAALMMVRFQDRRRAEIEELLRTIEYANSEVYDLSLDDDFLPDDLEREVS